MQKYLPVLTRCPLFAHIRPEDIPSILACLNAAVRPYGKGEAILEEGMPVSRFGILLDGTAQVVRIDYFGNRSVLSRLEPGELFAEAFAFSDMQTLPVSVVALGRAQALLIDPFRLLNTCSSACSFHHQLIRNMMKIMAVRNLSFIQKMEITSRRSTREKLMAYLTLQAEKAGSSAFVIPFDRQELADYLEVDRSGLSSEIGKLRREGVIECRRSHFRLLEHSEKLAF